MSNPSYRSCRSCKLSTVKLYTVKECAEIFRRTPETILRWIEEDKIQALKLGNKYLISQTEIDKILLVPGSNFPTFDHI